MTDAKKAILARRARFLAAAMAGAAVAACDKPRACLEPPLASSAPISPAEPQVCLKMAVPPRDAGDGDASTASVDASTDASVPKDAAAKDAAADAKKTPVGPPPATCLTMF